MHVLQEEEISFVSGCSVVWVAIGPFPLAAIYVAEAVAEFLVSEVK